MHLLILNLFASLNSILFVTVSAGHGHSKENV